MVEFGVFPLDVSARTSSVYASKEEALHFMRMEGVTLTATDEELMDMLLEEESRAIEADTNRVFFPSSSETRLFDGNGLRDMIIDLVSVSAMALDDVALVAGAEEDYVLNPATPKVGHPYDAVRRVGGSLTWPVGVRNVSITGVFGWSEAPFNVRFSCLNRVKRRWEDRVRENSMRKKEEGAVVYERFGDLSIRRAEKREVWGFRRGADHDER